MSLLGLVLIVALSCRSSGALSSLVDMLASSYAKLSQIKGDIAGVNHTQTLHNNNVTENTHLGDYEGPNQYYTATTIRNYPIVGSETHNGFRDFNKSSRNVSTFEDKWGSPFNGTQYSHTSNKNRAHRISPSHNSSGYLIRNSSRITSIVQDKVQQQNHSSRRQHSYFRTPQHHVQYNNRRVSSERYGNKGYVQQISSRIYPYKLGPDKETPLQNTQSGKDSQKQSDNKATAMQPPQRKPSQEMEANNMNSENPYKGYEMDTHNGHKMNTYNGYEMDTYNGHEMDSHNGHEMDSHNGHEMDSHNGHEMDTHNGYEMDHHHGHEVDSHDHEHQHFYVEHLPPWALVEEIEEHHTTTTPPPPKEKVPHKKQQVTGYYYIGRKLFYVPLYAAILFVSYVTLLIIRSITKHKAQAPFNYYTGFVARKDDISERVAKAISEVEERYA
ncbi:LIM domain-containing protein A-like [Periplaneta americana]|uniref:LIM domain-containing protein A-like n=1 Tax=Periplaneta americana TaxID=6978 RepID=UPI0037E76CEE